MYSEETCMGKRHVYNRNNAQNTWMKRAKVIALFLHPFFTGCDINMLSRVYDIKPDRIRSWIYSTPLFSHWIDILHKLNISDIFEILPPSYRDKYMQKKKDNNNLMFPKMSNRSELNYSRLNSN